MRPTVADQQAATDCGKPALSASGSEMAAQFCVWAKERSHKCVRLMRIVNVSCNRRKPNNSSKAICDSNTHTHIRTHTLTMVIMRTGRVPRPSPVSYLLSPISYLLSANSTTHHQGRRLSRLQFAYLIDTQV